MSAEEPSKNGASLAPKGEKRDAAKGQEADGPHIEVRSLEKTFGTTKVLTDVNMSIGRGHIAVIIGGFALVGAGLSNVVPCVFSTAAQRASSPAAGIAEVSTAGFGGFLTGPPMIGAIAARHGMRAGIGVIAVAATLAAVLSLRLKSAGSAPK